jgi:hypothetical protein
MGGWFDGHTWQDYLDNFNPEAHAYFEALRESVVNTQHWINGEQHQNADDGVPMFEDGTVGQFSFRAWGDLMAAISPDLIEPTRTQLESSGLPWVMENVPGAPMKNPIQLCGTSFGLEVRRHRLFELSGFFFMSPPCNHERNKRGTWVGSTNRPNGRRVAQIGTYRIPLEKQKAAMGVDWKVTLHELSEAIPPAYTEFIGSQLLQFVRTPELREREE